jgi:hypothetical protein
MHKSAGELKPRDCFSMAGAHFVITATYEVDDTDLIKIAFVPILKTSPMQYAILHRKQFFMTL